jgi:hypothetical protein
LTADLQARSANPLHVSDVAAQQNDVHVVVTQQVGAAAGKALVWVEIGQVRFIVIKVLARALNVGVIVANLEGFSQSFLR